MDKKPKVTVLGKEIEIKPCSLKWTEKGDNLKDISNVKIILPDIARLENDLKLTIINSNNYIYCVIRKHINNAYLEIVGSDERLYGMITGLHMESNKGSYEFFFWMNSSIIGEFHIQGIYRAYHINNGNDEITIKVERDQIDKWCNRRILLNKLN